MPPAGTGISISGALNLRGLGGWPVRDGGRVRPGQVFRSTELSSLDSAGVAEFSRLGIRTVFDLRTKAERDSHPDQLPPDTVQVFADILADSCDVAPTQLAAVIDEPSRAAELLGRGQAIDLFAAAYRELVCLPSARTGYRTVFVDLMFADYRPALFHCTAGKDRAGWCAAALLMLLGVPDEDVMTDYLLTNDQLLPSLQPVLDGFEEHGADPELLLPVLGVRREYLQAALREMRLRYGTIEGYFADGLGLDHAAQQALRDALVEV